MAGMELAVANPNFFWFIELGAFLEFHKMLGGNFGNLRPKNACAPHVSNFPSNWMEKRSGCIANF